MTMIFPEPLAIQIPRGDPGLESIRAAILARFPQAKFGISMEDGCLTIVSFSLETFELLYGEPAWAGMLRMR